MKKIVKAALLVAVCSAVLAVVPSGKVEAAQKPKLSAKKVTVAVGKKKKIKIKGTKKKVTWKSSNKKVATVKKSGKNGAVIQGKKAGKATITARSGKKTLTCQVSVKGQRISGRFSVEPVQAEENNGTKCKTASGRVVNGGLVKIKAAGKTYKTRADKQGYFLFENLDLNKWDEIKILAYKKENGKWKKYANVSTMVCPIAPNYKSEVSLKDNETFFRKVHTAINTIFPDGAEHYSESERCWKIAKWLCDNCKYDYAVYGHKAERPHSYDAYGAIMHGLAVCEGYSFAYKVLLTEVGIECEIVTGIADGIGGWGKHAWNQVKVDGSWYNVDVTWTDGDDPEMWHKADLYFMKSDSDFPGHKDTNGNQCNNTRFDDNVTREIWVDDGEGFKINIGNETIWDTGDFRNR